LRERRGLPRDDQAWNTLIDARIEVTREMRRLAAISDESAPTVKALERKLEAIERALARLHDLGLRPTEAKVPTLSEETSE
jgi:hypothetical protein